MSLSKIKSHIVERWERYWFTPDSLRRLAICRILIFGFMTWDLFVYRPIVRSLGDAPMVFFKPLIIIELLHLGPPTRLVLDVVFYLLILFALGAFIGFKTKLCISAYFILYIYWIGEWFSFGHVHHGHSILAFFTAALLLSPCGKVVSVDELLARIKASIKKGEFQKERTESLQSEYARWPLQLIQVLICLIYFLSGYAKLRYSGLEWANGSTLQYHLIRHSTEYGLLLAQNFFLCKALSIFALCFELVFPIILILPKLAWIILPLGVLFHMGTGVTMATPFYQLWFCYIAFINFDRLGVWLRTKFGTPFNSGDLKVIFDGGCPLCIRSMTIISYFDWFKRVDYLDLSHWEQISSLYPNLDREKCLEQMHVVDGESKIYAGFFAFRRLARAIPLFWAFVPILYLPMIPIVGQFVYRRVARNRARTKTVCTLHTCK